jgi:RHS repeat-associated protein
VRGPSSPALRQPPADQQSGRRDPSTSLAQFGVRACTWSTGRFYQPDPHPDSLIGPSRYAYAGCNPANFVDPTGTSHCPPERILGLASALALLAGGTYYLYTGALALGMAAISPVGLIAILLVVVVLAWEPAWELAECLLE